jgi:hypothetical protein
MTATPAVAGRSYSALGRRLASTGAAPISLEVTSGGSLISGTLSASGTAVAVVPRFKNGTCNGAAVPIETIGVITGSGSVTL